MATREGEEFTKLAKRAYLTPKASEHRGTFKVKTQNKEEYFVAFDGQLLGLDMLIQESKNSAYGPSILYLFKMNDNNLGRVDVYVAADSDRCCSLINQYLCLNTKKDCELKVFRISDYIGLNIGNVGQTTILRKFAKIETDKNTQVSQAKYVGVPDVVKTPKKINAKGEQEYDYDNSARVLFYLQEVCKAYPTMFDGEMFEPQVVSTDPQSPYAQAITQANLKILNSEFQQTEEVVSKSEVMVWLEGKRNDLHDKIWNLIHDFVDTNNQISPSVVDKLQGQIQSIIKLKGKTSEDCQEICSFYSQVFHECLHKKLPYLALHPKTFEFDANGLVIFNQPILSNNKPSDDDELPF